MVTEVMHLAINVYLDGEKPEAHLGDLTSRKSEPVVETFDYSPIAGIGSTLNFL